MAFDRYSTCQLFEYCFCRTLFSGYDCIFTFSYCRRLSTLPLYILLVWYFPIYKSLIRKRAVTQAMTQSHLIEVLGGIQTVKAQHFGYARWKWQDRYRNFVSEGFKSTAVSASAGEVEGFKPAGGLLVLWIGMV